MESILWAFIYASAFYFMMRYCGCGAHRKSREGHISSCADLNILADLKRSYSRDPVCGRAVASHDAYTRVYHHDEYHFCSRTCRMLFEQSPDRYLIERRLVS